MTTTRLGNALRSPFSSKVAASPPPKKATSYSLAATVRHSTHGSASQITPC